MVLPTGLLQVVSSELEWVQFELNTSVVDHILSDRHCRGGAKTQEKESIWKGFLFSKEKENKTPQQLWLFVKIFTQTS